MRVSRWLPCLAAAAVLAAMHGTARAQTDCPMDTLWAQSKLQVFGALYTRAAKVDTTFLNGCGRGIAQYDFGAGTFVSEIDFTCSGWTSITAWDEYTIAGLDPGTPVSFRVELEADAQMLMVPGMYPNINASARLSAGGATAAMSATTLPQHEVLALPLTQDAGTPFAVSIALRTSTNVSGGHTRVETALRFVGLPDGARVESCQGFHGMVVPSRQTTWGALKAIYR
jgi:hypothetical protein